MILRTVIFILIAYFFLEDYNSKRSRYKLLIFLVLIIAYINGISYFQSLDDRIRLSTLVISAIIGGFYIYKRTEEYKIDKFEIKKEARGEEKYKKEIDEFRRKNSIKESINKEEKTNEIIIENKKAD